MQNVIHTDEVLLEGEGSEFHSICRWKTVLSGAGFGLTVGMAFVFPPSEDKPSEEADKTKCHTHSHDELYYLIEGSGVTTIDGKDVPTAAGTAIFLPGGCSHGFRNTGSSVAKLLYVFACDAFEEVEYKHEESSASTDADEDAVQDAVQSKPLICNELNVPQQWDSAFPNCGWRVLIGEGDNDGANRRSDMTLLRTELLPEQQTGKTILHMHSQPEIYCIVKGTGVVYIAGRLHPVRAGSIVLIPKWTAHAILNTGLEPVEMVDIFGARNLEDVQFHFSKDETAANSANVFGHEAVPSPMQTQVRFRQEPLALKSRL
jgi:mannose-6-phosphate isomerase-like protein (cupin superfamily)